VAIGVKCSIPDYMMDIIAGRFDVLEIMYWLGIAAGNKGVLEPRSNVAAQTCQQKRGN
jgi:hypothetical protein